MNKTKRTATIVGILFILATVLSLASSSLTDPLTGATNYLAIIAAKQNQIIVGALLLLGAALSIVLIPAAIFPVLKPKNESIAVGYLGIRIVEAVTLVVDTIVLLLLVTLSQQYVAAQASAASYFQTLGAMLLGTHNWIFPLNPIVFGIGGLMLYYLLFRSKVIPRWLSGWGFIGAVLILMAGLLGMFSSFLVVLAVPIAVQEMAMAVWLIIKGFNPAAVDQSLTS